MGRNCPLGFGLDLNGMLSREIDDHINSKIYSMLGTCTNEELLKYQLAIAQKSVLLLQNEIADLRGKLEVQVSKHKNEVNELQFQLETQTIKYNKAKDEASLNARALKRCIANHQQLKEELQRDMPCESSVEQGNQRMQEFGEEAQTIIPTELSTKKKCHRMREYREEAQTIIATELSPNKNYQMQEFREEMQMSTPTELSPKQRCQRMREFREEAQTIIAIELSPNKNCQMQEFRKEMQMSTPTELSPKQRCQDGERQYKWGGGRKSTKKRLLQELDPNIDDLGYRVSMPEDTDEV